MTGERPEASTVGNDEIEATVMFTDIRNFSSIAEILTATDTAALLNGYFKDVARHILETRGTLLRYIGDAVFAIWGAPFRSEDHAVSACRTAVALSRMQEKIGEAPAGWVVTRIGVHTGSMLVGNVGTHQNLDYTAVGDAVNVASRLEGINKIFGTLAIASGDTISQTDGQFVVRLLGKVRVAGRKEPVEIYEILGERGHEVRLSEEALDCFGAALKSYTAGRLEDAADRFRETRDRCDRGDGASKFYLRTLASQMTAPRRDDWDGVINLTGSDHGG